MRLFVITRPIKGDAAPAAGPYRGCAEAFLPAPAPAIGWAQANDYRASSTRLAG